MGIDRTIYLFFIFIAMGFCTPISEPFFEHRAFRSTEFYKPASSLVDIHISSATYIFYTCICSLLELFHCIPCHTLLPETRGNPQIPEFSRVLLFSKPFFSFFVAWAIYYLRILIRFLLYNNFNFPVFVPYNWCSALIPNYKKCNSFRLQAQKQFTKRTVKYSA